jgi:hypothetical protein
MAQLVRMLLLSVHTPENQRIVYVSFYLTDDA